MLEPLSFQIRLNKRLQHAIEYWLIDSIQFTLKIKISISSVRKKKKKIMVFFFFIWSLLVGVAEVKNVILRIIIQVIK